MQPLFLVGIHFAGCVQESFGFKGAIALYATVSSWKFLIYFEDSRHIHVNISALVLLSLKLEVKYYMIGALSGFNRRLENELLPALAFCPFKCFYILQKIKEI